MVGATLVVALERQGAPSSMVGATLVVALERQGSRPRTVMNFNAARHVQPRLCSHLSPLCHKCCGYLSHLFHR
jgi:hypothetical protein